MIQHIIIAIIAIIGSLVLFLKPIQIETGFVGITYKWGKIIDSIMDPGFHFYNAFTSRVILVETRPQKDTINNVPCGTNDGLMLNFEYIEVGNQLPRNYSIDVITRYGSEYDEYLVKDLIKHQINVICSKKSAHQIAIEQFEILDDELKEFIQSENDRQVTGLEINFVRLSKPRLPKSIEENYLALASERTKLKVEHERTKRLEAEKASEMLVLQNDNAMKLETAAKQNEIMINNMKAKQTEQYINNEMIIAAAKANAEKIMLEANALASMYAIPGYTDIEKVKAIANNEKIYYGEKLPINFPLLKNN